MVTFRKAPDDIEEAKYILALISGDIGVRMGELTKDRPTLTKLLKREEKWQGIVDDLADEETRRSNPDIFVAPAKTAGRAGAKPKEEVPPPQK